ncbi:MAG TPA: pilus assembly protein PilM [Nitrospirota bacterium]|jgi:Tfp pilus assembly PilM family ATPase
MFGILDRRPGVGLELGQRMVRAAAVKKGRDAFTLEWTAEGIVPPGMLVDSFTEPNIPDIKAFSDLLRELFARARRSGARINVALPDYVSRITIMDFDNLPAKKADVDQMIKWRLKKVTPFDIELASLRSQYLGKFAGKEKDQHRFLISTIKTDIIEEYEQAVKAAGLKPEGLGLSSFSIWNLYHDFILNEAGGQGNFALMNLIGGKLTVMVFDRGVPHFLRLKDLGKADGAQALNADVNRVMRELSASLTYYRENFADTPVARVYITGDDGGLKDLSVKIRENTPIDARVLDIEKVVKSGKAPVGALLLSYSAACGAATE